MSLMVCFLQSSIFFLPLHIYFLSHFEKYHKRLCTHVDGDTDRQQLMSIERWNNTFAIPLVVFLWTSVVLQCFDAEWISPVCFATIDWVAISSVITTASVRLLFFFIPSQCGKKELQLCHRRTLQNHHPPQNRFYFFSLNTQQIYMCYSFCWEQVMHSYFWIRCCPLDVEEVLHPFCWMWCGYIFIDVVWKCFESEWFSSYILQCLIDSLIKLEWWTNFALILWSLHHLCRCQSFLHQQWGWTWPQSVLCWCWSDHGIHNLPPVLHYLQHSFIGTHRINYRIPCRQNNSNPSQHHCPSV